MGENQEVYSRLEDNPKFQEAVRQKDIALMSGNVEAMKEQIMSFRCIATGTWKMRDAHGVDVHAEKNKCTQHVKELASALEVQHPAKVYDALSYYQYALGDGPDYVDFLDFMNPIMRKAVIDDPRSAREATNRIVSNNAHPQEK